MTLMKPLVLILLLISHGLTQFGISLPDQTWRPWMQSISPQAVAVCTFLLFGVRAAADLGLCLWIIGPERRRAAWSALSSWAFPAQKDRKDLEKSHTA